MTQPRAPYPTKAQILRTVKAARAAGVEVAGFRVDADGAIVVFGKNAAPMDEFSQWQETRPS